MWTDIRYALRVLIKSPGFTLIAILTLALCSGLTTALFSVIHGVLIRPLSFRDPDRLVILWEKMIMQKRDISVSYLNYKDWVEQNTTFESLTAFRLDTLNVTGKGEAERVRARMVSSNFLSTLGVQPALGRDFRPEEDRLETTPVALLSHRAWKSMFHQDSGILGQPIRINDKVFTVIGVMPEDFHLFTEVDLFVPIGLHSVLWPKRDNHSGIYVIGRLKKGVGAGDAQAEMDQIALRLQKQYPDTNAGKGIHLESLARNITGDARPALWLLFGAVVFVLLIGCANLSNMMMARGMSRQKEISIRMAVGASRFNLFRQFLTESLLVAFAGGAIGLFLASNALELLLWLRPENLPRQEEIRMDWVVLAFSFVVSALSGIAFGLLPAFQSSKLQLHESMKEGGALPSFRARYRFRHMLVISQVALSLLLLIGAGLMIRSILVVLQSSPGFNPAGLLTVHLSLSDTRYAGPKVLQYLEEAQRRIAQLPGVKAVAFTNGLPIAGANEGVFWVDGRPKPKPGEELPVVQYYVSPNYLQTIGIPLKRGHYLLPSERSNSPWKVVVDDSLAAKYFAKEDPMGKGILLAENFPSFEIVGIAGHVKHYGLDVRPPIEEQFYISMLQIPDEFLSQVGKDIHLVIRASVDPMQVADAVRKELKLMDPEQPVSAPVTMESLIDESLAARRFSVILLSLFAVVALALAAAGIYGVLSYTVSQRLREIGIRMAVGAKRRDVLRLVLSGGFRLISTGIVLGIVASLALSRLMESQLYAVKATDPITFLLISVLLCFVGMAATYIPANRAMNVDPVIVLKHE